MEVMLAIRAGQLTMNGVVEAAHLLADAELAARRTGCSARTRACR
jgi:hypothetical protein